MSQKTRITGRRKEIVVRNTPMSNDELSDSVCPSAGTSIFGIANKINEMIPLTMKSEMRNWKIFGMLLEHKPKREINKRGGGNCDTEGKKLRNL